MSRRYLLAGALAIAATCAAVQSAAAQPASWPSKPIRIIVPFAPGAFTDASARLVAKELGDQLGQPVIVENKTGAGGTIGADAVAKAPPDGYTLLITETSFAMTPALHAEWAQDVLAAAGGWAPDHQMVHPVAPGFTARGTSTLYREDGTVAAQWVKTTADDEARRAALEAACAAMAEKIPRESL